MGHSCSKPRPSSRGFCSTSGSGRFRGRPFAARTSWETSAFRPDDGRGGKFLLLPPGYEGDVPEGVFPYRSQTNNVFIFLRAFYQDPKDLAPAVTLLERTRVYPLGNENTAKAMTFPNGSRVRVDMLPRTNASAFEQLKQLVDSETPHLADPD